MLGPTRVPEVHVHGHGGRLVLATTCVGIVRGNLICLGPSDLLDATRRGQHHCLLPPEIPRPCASS